MGDAADDAIEQEWFREFNGGEYDIYDEYDDYNEPVDSYDQFDAYDELVRKPFIDWQARRWGARARARCKWPKKTR